MKLDLQSLFGLHVHRCTLYSLTETPQLPPIPLHMGSYTRALLVSQDRRHLFVTPWLTLLHIILQSSLQRRSLSLLGMLSRRILYKLQNSDKILCTARWSSFKKMRECNIPPKRFSSGQIKNGIKIAGTDILHSLYRAGIFKPLWSLGIDAKASIPPAYVVWRAGTITLFLLGA
jgi:hypothetical protein